MAINIFEPLTFSTQGINDLATKTSLVVSDGKITVDTVEPTKAISFVGGSFAEVEGKGIKWIGGSKSKTLTLRQSKLWTDTSINLAESEAYEISNIPVISLSELGPSVTKSNLKQLGVLRSLNVAGDANIGDFAVFSSELNRLGINTETPNAAIGIRENNVEIILGSVKSNTASIGTVTNDSVEIITGNTPRITVSNKGDVQILGTLYVDKIVTTQSDESVTFRQTGDSSNYGKGIRWMGMPGPARQLVYQGGPDRIWSTDIIDLADTKYFSINRMPVLSASTLGDSVTDSNLQKLGVLRSLQVAGDAAVTRTLSTSKVSIGSFSVTDHELSGSEDIKVTRNDVTELTIGSNIVIGNVANKHRTVSVFGNLAIGNAVSEEGVSLTVAGSVSFDNKKFEIGSGIPTTGNFNKGDIVWNTDPKATDYIGWVCVVGGAPGSWLPFGAIANQ